MPVIIEPKHDGETIGETGAGTASLGLLVGVHVAIYLGAAFLFPPEAGDQLIAVIFGVLLVLVSVNDIRTFEIPDLFSVLLIGSGLIYLWGFRPSDAAMHFAAGVCFAALLYLVGTIYMRYRGFPGLGLGDVKLVAGLGVWLGIEGSVWTLLAASLSGITVLLVLAVIRRQPVETLQVSGVAFGPFLCLSAWVIWLAETGV